MENILSKTENKNQAKMGIKTAAKMIASASWEVDWAGVIYELIDQNDDRLLLSQSLLFCLIQERFCLGFRLGDICRI